MDKICIENLKIFAYHGVFDEEKRTGQNFYVNAVLELDAEKAGMLDDLSLSEDYGKVCLLIESVMTEASYDLIEAAAQAVACEILRNFPLVRSAEVEIKKPEAPIKMEFGSVSVKIKRGWHTAVIALGSNIGESRQLIENAVNSFRESGSFRNVRASDLIVTKPYGYTDQPDFLNGALICETLYSPHGLLDLMQSIENAAGRTREIHWGPRTLDLDLIFYDEEIISDSRLIVPHPDMQNRRFVLEPVAQLAPWYRHPILRSTAAQLLDKLGDEEKKKSPEKTISIIAAVSKNGVIGSKGRLPWDIPEDRLHFKWLTTGNVLIMGRKTFESIGSALTDRQTIVVTKTAEYSGDPVAARSLEEAIEIAQKAENAPEIFICGGEQIYAEGMKYARQLYLTELDDEYEGDTRFPEFDREKFSLVKSVRSDKNRLSFRLYERSGS